MSSVSQIFESVSDADAKQCLRELKEWCTTGILVEGSFRNLERNVREITCLDEGASLRFTETELLRRVAFKWAGI